MLSPNGVVQLTRYTYTPQPTTVYNLEVYRTHTYLVGTMEAVVHNPGGGCPVGELNTNSIEGVDRLSGQIYKNGNGLEVDISLVYKKEGYSGKVFENLLEHLSNVAEQNGATKSLRIKFEGVNAETAEMYKKQGEHYGFEVTQEKSAISTKTNPNYNMIWSE